MTARARELNGVLDQGGEVGVEELVRRGSFPGRWCMRWRRR